MENEELRKRFKTLWHVVKELYSRVLALEEVEYERRSRYAKISKKLDSAFDMVQGKKGRKDFE